MFEGIPLLSPPPRSIALQTSRGRNIPNQIDIDPEPRHVEKFRALVAEHGGWEERKPPTGGYNCVGHVWASRRTGVFEEEHVFAILEDDGYRRLDHGEQPLSGDVAIYWDSASSRNFLHVGVVEMREGATPKSPRVPWILSKLDSCMGEVLHHAHHVPYEQGSYVLEFWTDRPKPPASRGGVR